MTEEQLDNLKQEYLQTLRAFARDHTIYLEQDGQELTYCIFDPKEKDPFVPVTGYTENDEQMKSVTEYLQNSLTINDQDALEQKRGNFNFIKARMSSFQAQYGTLYTVSDAHEEFTKMVTTYDDNWNREITLENYPMVGYFYIDASRTFSERFYGVYEPEINHYIQNHFSLKDSFALYADVIKAAHDKFGQIYVADQNAYCQEYTAINPLGDEPESVFVISARCLEYVTLHRELEERFNIKRWNCEQSEIAAYRDPGNKHIWTNPEKVQELVEMYGWSKLRHASDELKADQDFVLSLMAKNPKALQYAADHLRDDEDFLRDKAFAVTSDIETECLSERLQHEIGSCDPYKYLRAKQASQSLQASLDAQYGNEVAEDDEPEHKPKFKI